MTAKEKNSPIAIQAFHQDLASGVHEVLTADRIWDIVLQGALLEPIRCSLNTGQLEAMHAMIPTDLWLRITN